MTIFGELSLDSTLLLRLLDELLCVPPTATVVDNLGAGFGGIEVGVSSREAW
jgi:hypothetical protein